MLALKLILIRFFEKIYPRLAIDISAKVFATPRRIPRPAHEDKLIETAERFVFKNNLVSYKFGNGQKNVLLIHGWEGRGTQLGSFVEPLVKMGFTVYAVDAPAHGESPGKILTPVLYASFIKSIVYELGEVHTIIAHSFGSGSSALAAAETRKVNKLVLIAGPNQYIKIVNHFARLMKFSEKTRLKFIDKVTEIVGLHPEQMVVSDFLNQCEIPVILIHDKHDKPVPVEASQAIATSVPRSQLIVTEGLGHRRILKDSNVIEAVMKFITE